MSGAAKRFLIHNADGTHQFVVAETAEEAASIAQSNDGAGTAPAPSEGGSSEATASEGAAGVDITLSTAKLLAFVNDAEGEERVERAQVVRAAELATGKKPRKGLVTGLDLAEAGE